MAGVLVLGSLALVSAAAPPAAAFGTSQPAPIPSISAGGYISCGVQADGSAACWGENGVPSNDVANVHPGGAATPPAGVKFLEVSSGYATACGVKTDRSIACWGSGRFEKLLRIPSGEFKHVVPGLNYVCALRTDDTIVCWGGDDLTLDPDQKVIRDVPAGQFTQLSMGSRHACALRADSSGSVVCWGHDTLRAGVSEGQTSVPPGTYSYVDVGNFTSCALRADGTAVCWGRNQGSQQSVPSGTFTQLSTGFAHVCGLRADNTVTCWGRNSEGQSSPIPTGTYTQVTAGTFHTCAMPTSGAPARCWGNNMSGRVQPNMNSVSPPTAYLGVAYRATFAMNPSPLSGAGAQVGVSPAPTFSLVEGELPPGLSLHPSGAVSGTPTAAGSHTFKVSASNGLSPRDCSKVSNTGDSMFCTPGETTSLATATRAFTINVAAEVAEPGAIAGRVTNSGSSAAIAGATVSVSHSDGTPVGQVTTDGEGNYAVTDLLPGGYTLTASSPDVSPQTKPATVDSMQTATVDFALAPRLTRPQVVGVWNNHWQTVSDGVFVEWSEQFDMLVQTGAGYSVHAQPDCSDAAIAKGIRSNWMAENPTSTTPRLPSRVRDIEMTGYENVTPGGTYYLRIAADTEFGAATLQKNLLTCAPFRAELRAMDHSNVTGTVKTEATGAAITGATVTVTRNIRQPGTVAGQATTDSTGYRVGNLPPSNYPIGGYNSSYTVAVSAPGYASKTGSARTTFNAGTASVAPGTSSATLDFVLNALPVAANDSYRHNGSDTALVVPAATGVLGNDTDAENNSLTAEVVSGPSNGVLTVSGDGSFSYQPNEDFVGADSFTYKAKDATGESAAATATITVGAGCKGLPATITGTSDRDRLTGTRGSDVIVGLGGNDMINGAGGGDVICGGSGNDSLNTGGGDDYADGGSGDDALRGDAGNDTLVGGAGADSVLGDDGNDVLSGGDGAPDSCQGGAGADVLADEHGCEKVGGIP